MNLLAQMLRFGIAGVLTNLAGYAAYLGLTEVLGFAPKPTMTVLYLAGVLLSFMANRSWVFRHQGSSGGVFVRFLLAHALGYSTNWLMLWDLVDLRGYPHYLVQAAAIMVVAALMFVTMRWFVFRQQAPVGGRR